MSFLSDAAILKMLKRGDRGDLPRKAINILLFYAWQSGVSQWSLSPTGTTLDLPTLRDGCARDLVDAIAHLAGMDPLVSSADRPSQVNPQAIADWLKVQEARPLAPEAEHTAVGVIRSASRGYLTRLEMLAELFPRLPALWPYLPVRLWQMTNGAEGYSPWCLLPRHATCQSRMTCIMGGQSILVHITYTPSRVDIHMVPEDPSPDTPSSEASPTHTAPRNAPE